MPYRYLSILSIFLFLACSEAPPEDTALPDTGFTLPYDLDHPDKVFDLPPSLREISGLCLSPDGKQLLAVNDEQGLIFHLNIHTGVIEQKQDFGKSDDYEGITATSKATYVVNSKGTVFEVKPEGKTEDYPTALNGSNDVEGICFDSTNNRLLIACKAVAGKGKSFRKKKAIYAFELSKKKLKKEPAFLIDRTEIARWKGGSRDFYDKFNEFLSTDQAPSAFGPSGLAISPIDGNLYVIASVGKTLAVLHQNGMILHARRLSSSRFQQPEGICFDRQGRMYISSEGKNGVSGRIFRFALNER